MAREIMRTRFRGLAAIVVLALFGLPACWSPEQGLDEHVGAPSEIAPIPGAEQGPGEEVDTLAIAPIQTCVGGGTCDDGYHCCGDGTRDWCCPQTAGCGPSYPDDACR